MAPYQDVSIMSTLASVLARNTSSQTSPSMIATMIASDNIAPQQLLNEFAETGSYWGSVSNAEYISDNASKGLEIKVTDKDGKIIDAVSPQSGFDAFAQFVVAYCINQTIFNAYKTAYPIIDTPNDFLQYIVDHTFFHGDATDGTKKQVFNKPKTKHSQDKIKRILNRLTQKQIKKMSDEELTEYIPKKYVEEETESENESE